MFEIRIICEAADREAVVSGLRSRFDIGLVRSSFSRSSGGERLYITADLPAATTWPTPEDAYALAPSIVREIGWTAQAAAERPFGTAPPREFWLRKAAVLDRIALADEREDAPGDAAEAATEAARRLMDLDGAGAIRNPRHYTRQQYVRWTKHQ
ncbi:hypothetical protein KZO11_17530 [Streptomyces anulatus]|uniref:hypothetical protein n=1 Tax=Streptomyces anulatus TaxID=1892 RepID=UPI001C5F0DC5|nr:hypothetical protein [Streptomyces anulatus]QYA95327.1 hypothetical protein KZO11_17530 [Streptomyces anulatus]